MRETLEDIYNIRKNADGKTRLPSAKIRTGKASPVRKNADGPSAKMRTALYFRGGLRR